MLTQKTESIGWEVRGMREYLPNLRSHTDLTAVQNSMAEIQKSLTEMTTLLEQAGKKKELSISPPGLDTALSVLAWLILLLLGTLVGMVVLRTIWSGLAADPVMDSTTMPHRSDHKTLRREQEKKIALGHKEDDHEEEPTWQQSLG